MDIGLTAELAPILWGIIALTLVIAGAILAGVDPDLAEVYLGNPRWLLASAVLAIGILATVIATQPDLGYGLRALLAN